MTGKVSPLTHCFEYEAPTSPLEQQLCSSEAVSWHDGLIPEPLHTGLARDPLIITVVLALTVVMMFSFSHCRKFFKNLPQDLWGIRRRENAFDEQPSYQQRTFVFLILQLIVCETIILYAWLCQPVNNPTATQIETTVALLFALSLAYYLFQLIAYTVVGWIFTDDTGFRLFLRGFNTSSALLGLLLLLPALSAIFYPSDSGIMITISLILYFLARIIFIFKGFRIFYHNFFSLFYFILYLCTLEIIPLLMFYTEARFLCNFQF